MLHTTRGTPGGWLSLVVGVLLLILAASWVAAVSFNSMPWVAGLFGFLLLGVAWKLRQTRIVAFIYLLYAAGFVVLGGWISIATVTQ